MVVLLAIPCNDEAQRRPVKCTSHVRQQHARRMDAHWKLGRLVASLRAGHRSTRALGLLQRHRKQGVSMYRSIMI